MNPLASAKCAGRLLMALAAVSALLFAAGCTSSTSTSTNKQGFTNSSFSGTYVISIQGTDVNLTTTGVVPLAIMGTLQPNGSGGFNTAGTVLDIIDPGNTGINQGVTIGASSAYSVGQDGRGTATLVTNVANIGTLDIDFVLSSTSGGLISLFNTSTIPATGSGTIDLQTATSQSALTSLAFSLYGGDSSGAPAATVGAFSLNSSGVIQAGGTQDINDNGSSAASNGTTGIAITAGNVTLNSAGIRGHGHVDQRVLEQQLQLARS